MPNLGLIGYAKWILYVAVGSPKGTHDARLLNESSIYSNIICGNVIWDGVAQLGDFGEIPRNTIGDSFSLFAWLIKAYNENTRDNQKKYSKKRLCGARVVIENAYEMLKWHW